MKKANDLLVFFTIKIFAKAVSSFVSLQRFSGTNFAELLWVMFSSLQFVLFEQLKQFAQLERSIVKQKII